MKYWEGLNNDAYQVALRAGAESLVDVAIAAREANPPPWRKSKIVSRDTLS
jgi:hypothetical protein